MEINKHDLHRGLIYLWLKESKKYQNVINHTLEKLITMTEMLNQCFPLVKKQRLFPMHLIIHLYISLKIEKFYY